MGLEFTGAASVGALCMVNEGGFVKAGPAFAARICGVVKELMAFALD
jgi:hypothetical protein